MAALLATLLALAAQEDDLPALVEKLRSDSIEERERAEKEIVEFGLAAVRSLEKAARDPDREVAIRATALLLRVEVRRRVTPSLRASFPGLDTRLERGEPHEWTSAFLEIAGQLQGDRRLPYGPADLEGLVIPALRNAPEESMLTQVCTEATTWRLEAALPEIAGLVDHAQPTVRVAAINALERFEARAYLGKVVGRMGDPDQSVRRAANKALHKFGLERAASGLIPLLDHENPEVREEILKLLGQAKTPKAGSAAARLLADPVPAVRQQALRTLESIGEKNVSDHVAELLNDADPFVRLQALRALARVGDPATAPAVSRFLKDSELTIRQEAIRTIGALRWKEGVPELTRLLETRELRQSSIHALGLIGTSETVQPLVRCLTDSDAYVRQQALLALGQAGAEDAIRSVAPLLKDADPRVRLRAAETLCRLGSREGVPLILQEAERSPSTRLFLFNALRRRETWTRLRAERMVLPVASTTGDLLNAFHAPLGWVQFSVDFGISPASRAGVPRLWEEGMEMSLLEAVERSVGRIPCEAVLETDRLHILTPAEGVAFWKEWWEKHK